MNSVDRRAFLKRTSYAIGSGAAATALGNLLVHAEELTTPAKAASTSLVPVADDASGFELLALPKGFRFRSYGWTGDALTGDTPTPGLHDGMSVIRADEKSLTLCRNHEVESDKGTFAKGPVYDRKAGAGCTSLTFDLVKGEFLESHASLTGTLRNCAGGLTPWGSWLTCEETVLGPGDEVDGRRVEYEREHGFIFEVPAHGKATAEPLTAMGRFVHEAVAVDPKTSIVYETEDRKTAGLYRFVPNTPRKLADGGRLQMMKVAGRQDMRRGMRVGDQFSTSWVDIEDPTRPHTPNTQDTLGVYSQGRQQGASTFARLEGCWFDQGKIYVVSTSGGDKGHGQVFQYDPAEETIRLIFESPSKEVLDSPDNMCVSRSGDIVLCEDGSQVPQRIHRLSPAGELTPLVANNAIVNDRRRGIRGDFRGKEWAGVCISPDDKWLFANLQTPGITFAISRRDGRPLFS